MIDTVVLHRRHAARYREIVRVLIAHGLGGLIVPIDVVARLRRPWLRSATPAEAGRMRSSRIRARHLREALEELGPAFIKLGQILSTRADILPPDYVAELGRLQDQVKPEDHEIIRRRIETELGAPIETLFQAFDDRPLAAASIGQVHAATLPNGREVVVKIQRPGIRRLVNEDLAILAEVARIAERRSTFLRTSDVTGLISEFAWTIRAELDYLREARNAERIRTGLAGRPGIRIPEVIWERTTSSVLTLERIRGIRIDDVERLRVAGHLAPAIIARTVDALAVQILDVGLFHADPHPGNFVVCEDGAVGVFDFGLVGTIDERLRERLIMLALACAERDSGRIVDEMAVLGAVPAGWDRRAMERDISHLVAQYVGAPLREIPLAVILGDVMNMIRRHRLRLPAELALLAKTASMAEALGRRLDPDLNVIAVVEPTIRQAVRRFYSPSFWRDKFRLRPLEVAFLTAALPGHIQRLISRIDRNDLTFHVHYDELPETLRGLNSMVNRLALAIMSAAGGIGVAILFLAMQPAWPSWQGALFVAAFAGLALIVVNVLLRIWRSSR